MLAGPPRLVSLISLLFFLILSWRLVHTPASPVLRVEDIAPKPSLLPADPLDFSIPLRFTDGQAKPAGSNYSWLIVIPKTKEEDLAWIRREISEENLMVYEVDNPDAEHKVPKNKGREAMVCGMNTILFH